MTEESPPDQARPSIDWGIWFQWVLASTLGWVVGLLFGDIGIGAILGLAQWFVLRQLLPQAGWWVVATTTGWVIGWALVISGALIPPGEGIINSLLAGGFIGVFVGLAQWLFVLRRHVPLAGWWVVTSAAAWAVAFTGLLGGTLVGTVAGAMTGFILDFLLRFSDS